MTTISTTSTSSSNTTSIIIIIIIITTTTTTTITIIAIMHYQYSSILRYIHIHIQSYTHTHIYIYWYIHQYSSFVIDISFDHICIILSMCHENPWASDLFPVTGGALRLRKRDSGDRAVVGGAEHGKVHGLGTGDAAVVAGPVEHQKPDPFMPRKMMEDVEKWWEIWWKSWFDMVWIYFLRPSIREKLGGNHSGKLKPCMCLLWSFWSFGMNI